MAGATIVCCRHAAVACRTAATVGQVSDIRPFRETNGKQASFAQEKAPYVKLLCIPSYVRHSMCREKRFAETMRRKMLESLIGENISLYSKRSKLHQIFSIAAFSYLRFMCSGVLLPNRNIHDKQNGKKMGMETCHVAIGPHTHTHTSPTQIPEKCQPFLSIFRLDPTLACSIIGAHFIQR